MARSGRKVVSGTRPEQWIPQLFPQALRWDRDGSKLAADQPGLDASGFPHTVELRGRGWPKDWRLLRWPVMGSAFLEASLDVVDPVNATSVAQEPLVVQIAPPASDGRLPSWFSPGSLDSMRPLLDTFATLKPQSLEQLLPALRILGLAVVAGVGLKITAAMLGSLDELPMLGRLLQLVGLVTAIQFVSRNALQQQKRAALLARIEQLKLDLLG